MIRRLQVVALAVSGLWLGATLHGPQTAAAPSEVVGSHCVAVDTYRNARGSFVLWASGRITRADGNPADLGAPYQDPPAAANLSGTPALQPSGSQGSPQVAVQAVVRPDGTFILFGDGRLRRPAHADAAAGQAGESSNVLAGCWRGGASVDSSRYRVTVAGNDLRIDLAEPLQGDYFAWAAGMQPSGTGVVPYLPVRGNGGSSIVLRQSRGLSDPSPDGYFFIARAR